MAKGKKTGGKDFQKGVCTNPNGRPPIPEEIKEARKLTQVEFERVANRFLYINRDELKSVLADPSTTVLEKLVGKIIDRAITDSSLIHLSFFLDRLVGKLPDKLEVKGSFHAMLVNTLQRIQQGTKETGEP